MDVPAAVSTLTTQELFNVVSGALIVGFSGFCAWALSRLVSTNDDDHHRYDRNIKKQQRALHKIQRHIGLEDEEDDLDDHS